MGAALVEMQAKSLDIVCVWIPRLLELGNHYLAAEFWGRHMGLADKNDLNNVAIYWPQKSRISAIQRSGRCPSFGEPKKLRQGGMVALVDREGNVLLLFRIARVEKRVPINAANGKHYERGCLLVARPGSMRRPGSRDPKVLGVNRHAPGAFAYFEDTSKRVVYELNGSDGGSKNHASMHKPFPALEYPFFANNIGKTWSQPEKELIQAYATWVGDVTMLAHHPLKETGLYTDLFIPRCWTLIEAKSAIARRVIREAIGQLFDYQRHYDRSPRLAVLLPKQPPKTVIELFQKKRITVIWRSQWGAFHDSAQGQLTRDLRRLARMRGIWGTVPRAITRR
jgi:hypothetical protein